MINPKAKLAANVFDEKIEKKSTRDGFGTGAVEAAKKDANIMVLSADLKESTRAEWFEKEFPERFLEMGIGEQNMATVGAGLALAGKIPFITSYAAFSPGRNYEQIRTTIAINDVPVKICGMHAGVSVGPDGATHQMLEDIAMMRALPNMVVVNPADAEEGRKATLAAAASGKPMYLRFGRANVPTFTTAETPFEVGKAITLWQGEHPKVVLATTGSMAYNALCAAKALAEDGIGSIVLHFHTIKPLDEDALVAAAKIAGKVLTIEEHQINGGFGGAVAECLSEKLPVPIRRIGLNDTFGQSGEPDELIRFFGLDADGIAKTARAFIA